VGGALERPMKNTDQNAGMQSINVHANEDDDRKANKEANNNPQRYNTKDMSMHAE
jgi:hypothetical protein